MGSCGCKSSLVTSRKIVPDATTNTSKKKKRPMILKLRKEIEARRIIYLSKDSNVPQLCIDESDLYKRRQGLTQVMFAS
jgi:hypothetical protein